VPEPPVFFAYTGGRQVGPLHFAEMADLAARGILQPEDLAWKSGTAEWVPASRLLAFPGRKPPSGVFESPAVADGETGSEAADGIAPARPAPPATGSRPPSGGDLPRQWHRVSLAKASDDPGIGLAETGDGAGALSADPAAGEAVGTGGPAGSARRLGSLLPLRRLDDEAVLGSPVTWALVFFGLGPLFMSAVTEDPLLRIRLFNFGCGALWVVFFYAAFRTGTATSRTVLSVFLGSVLFAALYFGLLTRWPPVSTLASWAAPGRGFGPRLLAALGGAALVQETGKLAVLLLVVRPMRELETDADGLFFGLIAGAAFGLSATVVQAWPLGVGSQYVPRIGGEDPTTALYAAFLGRAVRAMTQPFLQAVWTGVAGTFLARAFPPSGRTKAPGRAVLGLGLAVGLHALYASLAPATAFLSFLVAAAGLALLLALRRGAEEEPILSALR
jgi:RsiW-degrading membrane proteinase PrsW (M82 family)